MKPQSAKAKGRSLQKHVRQRLLDTFPLEEDDVLSRSMGSSGTDLHLSPHAKKYFGFDCECKNQERIQLWKSWEQCTANAALSPLLIVKRNRSEVLAVMRFEDLLELLKDTYV